MIRVRVQAEQCATCIFRPKNIMRLRPGRVKDMVAKACANESTIVCHETRGKVAGSGKGSVCRGFFDGYKTQPLQVAERLDLIDYTDPNKEKIT